MKTATIASIMVEDKPDASPASGSVGSRPDPLAACAPDRGGTLMLVAVFTAFEG